MNFSKKDVAHFFLPRKDVIRTYVIEDEKKEVTDFFSYYSLPSSILKKDSGYDKVNVIVFLINIFIYRLLILITMLQLLIV